MRTQIGLLSIVGFFGLLASAAAQTPSSPAIGAQFDGTYQLVSSVKANQTHVARGGKMGYCPDRTPGPLTIVHGHLQYTTETGHPFAGMVNPHGEFAMRRTAADEFEMHVSGNVDANGTIHAHQRGNSCSYHFVWQKQS